jgi:phage repressor protein C with HTH and peptisase S24 domain
MSIGSRIKEARTALNYTQSELAEALEITTGAVANYENEVSVPKPEILYKLMNVLKCDANYLYQDMYNSKNNDFIISSNEQSLIKKYRSLDGYGRKAINNLLEVEYERCNTVIEEDMPAYITKPYYAVGASAGNGEYLFDDLDKTSITLPDTPLNNKADLVIAVRGHSMEPTYYDGDKLLVKKQSELNIGDIGVFIINGESFVKELGKDKLISHNKQYQDIHCSDYDKMVTVGKVIGVI